MKLKNTLGVVIGSIVAATSFNALAQGQGAVEVEGFGKHYFSDSSRDFEDEGELYGAGVVTSSPMTFRWGCPMANTAT